MSLSTTTFQIVPGTSAVIYPYGVQTIAVGIRNAGPDTIYLSDQTTLDNGIPVAVGQSAKWPAGKALNAYVLNTQSTIQVYDASIGAPAAVTLAAPVNVQGGGELLYSGTPTVAAGMGFPTTITINAPTTGLLYPSVRLYISDTALPSTALNLGYSFNSATSQLSVGGLNTLAAGVQLNTDGNAYRIDAIIPTSGGYPFTLILTNYGPIDHPVTVKVFGQSALTPEITRDLSDLGRLARITLTGGTSVLLLPPSHTPYEVCLTPVNAAATTVATNNVIYYGGSPIIVGSYVLPQTLALNTTYVFVTYGTGFTESIPITWAGGGSILVCITKR